VNTSEIFQTLYKNYYIGDTETVLTINLIGNKAGIFYSAFNSVLQPESLKTDLTFEFVDESNAIVVKGNKEQILLLKQYLDNLEKSFKEQEIIQVLATKESFHNHIKNGLTEGTFDLQSYNIWSCGKCGYVMLWWKGRFPLQQPLMCPMCGSYQYRKSMA